MDNSGITIEEFFNSKGSAEVLLAVHPKEGTLTEEVKSSAVCAKGTARNRIEEATELGLLEHEIDTETDKKNAKRQFLTTGGRACVVAIVSLHLDETLKQLQELKTERTNLKEHLTGWLHSRGSLYFKGTREDDEFTDQFRNESLYPTEDVPDGFEEFIFGTDEDTREEIYNLEQLIDYEKLYESDQG
jgi:hypothetical protein